MYLSFCFYYVLHIFHQFTIIVYIYNRPYDLSFFIFHLSFRPKAALVPVFAVLLVVDHADGRQLYEVETHRIGVAVEVE